MTQIIPNGTQASPPVRSDPVQGRILIIDDDRSMCEILDSALRRRDFEVAWRTFHPTTAT